MTQVADSPLVEEIRIRCQQQDSGELLIRSAGQEWRLYFFMGKLLFGTGGMRVRRWQRLWQQFCSSVSWEELQSFKTTDDPWEYDLLSQGVARGRIKIEQARQLIDVCLQEVILAATQALGAEMSWNHQKVLPRQIRLADAGQILQELEQSRIPQDALGAQLDPDLVLEMSYPDLFRQQVSPKVFQVLERLLDGHSSVWQIARKMGRPLPMVSQSLSSFVEQGWLTPLSATDMLLPMAWRGGSSPPVTKPQMPSIACIDDSPTMGKAMERILAPAGYEVLLIEDPLKAVATLHKHKPVLIFLDLLMPGTNGYELCASLRKTSLFRDTPIIILTGQDGIVDRVRAKLVGASEFLTKPPKKDKVQAIVSKYLSSILM